MGTPAPRGTGQGLCSPGWHGMQRPWASRSGSIVSSLTLTRRMGYTCVRMRLLKPQEPTWDGYGGEQPMNAVFTVHGHREPANAIPHHTSANLAVHVGNAAVALGGAVELADLPHAKALRELLPDGRPQPVAHSQTHPVPPLNIPNRLPQQVAADLTNVLHYLRVAGRGPRQGPIRSRAWYEGAQGLLCAPSTLASVPCFCLTPYQGLFPPRELILLLASCPSERTQHCIGSTRRHSGSLAPPRLRNGPSFPDCEIGTVSLVMIL